MPRRRPPPVSAASATCCCISFLLLVVLLHHRLAVWPPPPTNSQQQRRLQLQPPGSQTPVSCTQEDTLLHSSSSWWIFASAKGCCKKKQQASAGSPAGDDTGAMGEQGRAPEQGTDIPDVSWYDSRYNSRTGRSQKPRRNPGKQRKRKHPVGHGGGGGHHDDDDESDDDERPSCCGVMPMYFVNTTHTIVLFKWWETLKPWQYAVSVVVCVLLGVFSVVLKVVRLRVEQRLASRDAEAASAAAAASAAGASAAGASAAAASASAAAAADEEESAHPVAGGLQAVEGKVPRAAGSGETLNSHGVGKGEQQPVARKEGRRLPAKAADVYRRITTGFPPGSNCCRMIQAFILYGYDYLLMLIVMSYNVGLFLAVTGGLALGFFFFGHLLVSGRNRGSPSPHPQGQQHLQDVEMEDFHAGDPLCCGA